LYQHHPTAFRNGETFNTAEQNQGSARVLAYALLNQLPAPETLLLFAEHYEAVLADPGGTNHQNIRQFMDHGWAGVSFDGTVLTAR
ncbi:MAG: HopJ type III effector protein, partial [Chitinophagaceae bacterium]